MYRMQYQEALLRMRRANGATQISRIAVAYIYDEIPELDITM